MQKHYGNPPPRDSGTQAVVGAVLAIVGVLAAFPSNLILKAVSEAAPQLVHAMPTVITSCEDVGEDRLRRPRRSEAVVGSNG